MTDPPEQQEAAECNCPDLDALEVLCRVFDDGADVAYDEWLEWYKPEQWLGPSRALGAFIYQRLKRASQGEEGRPLHGWKREVQWRRHDRTCECNYMLTTWPSYDFTREQGFCSHCGRFYDQPLEDGDSLRAAPAVEQREQRGCICNPPDPIVNGCPQHDPQGRM